MMRFGSEPRIVPGQRFRPAGVTGFGTRRRAWEVVDVARGTGGQRAVRLVAVGDPTASKTLALAALLDRSLYEPMNGGTQ